MAALGRLVAELALDSAQFTEGIKRAEKGFADFERSIASAATGAITSFAGQLLSLQAASALASAAVSSFTDTVKQLAILDDSAEKTGALVGTLAQLQVQAKISGQSFEGIESALIKLNKGLVNADDETKGAGRALDFLGIKAKDANGKLRDTGDITLEVAKKFSEFSDKGPGKAAVAIELFGKSGAQALPFLKDLAENTKELEGIFVGNTEAADRYEKAVQKLSVQKEQLRRVIVSELLPAATDFVTALVDLKKNSDGLAGSIKQLADDGSIARWGNQAALVIAGVIDQAITGINQFRALAKDLEGIAVIGQALVTRFNGGREFLAGNIEEFNKLGDKSREQFAEAGRLFKESETIAATASTKYVDAVRKQIEATNQLTYGYNAAKDGAVKLADATGKAGKELDGYGGKAGKASKEIEKTNATLKALDDLFNRLNNADVDTGLVKGTELLTKAFQTGLISAEKYANGLALVFAQSKTGIAALKAVAEGQAAIDKALNQETQTYIEGIDKQQAALEDLIKSLRAQNESLSEEANAIGLTDRERAKYLLNLQRDKDLKQAKTPYDEAEIKRLYDEKAALIDAKNSHEDYLTSLEQYKRIEGGITDFFVDLFTNGKKAFDNLGQTVKQFFIKLAAQFASKFVLNIATSALGGGGGGGLAGLFGGGSGGGFDLGSLFGGGSSDPTSSSPSFLSALPGAGGASSFLPSGLTAAMQPLMLPLMVAIGGAAISNLISGGREVFRGSNNILGSLLGGIPGGLINLLAGDRTGIKIDNSVRDGRGRKDIIGSALGSFDVSGDIGNEAFKPLIQTVQSLDKFIADNLLTEGTLNTVKENIQRISSDATDWFGFEDEAGAKVAIEKASKLFLQQRYSVVFDEIDKNVGGLIRTFAGSADELIAYITKLSSSAVVIGKLNAAVPGLNLTLSAFASLSDTAQQAVATLAVSLDSFITDTNATVTKIIADQQLGSVSSYQAAGDALVGMRRSLENGTIGIEEFAAGVGQLATAYAQATAKIAETYGALKDLFSGSQENFLLAGKSTEEKYDYFQKQAEDLFAQLAAATDPETIARISRKIDAAQNSAFNLLDPKAQAELASQFISGSQRAEKLAYDRLEAAGRALDKQNADFKTIINDALQAYAKKIEATADKEAATAAQNADTANKPVKIDITVNQNGTVEVNE